MKKTEEIKIRVTEKKYCEIKEAAQERGESISEYIRSRLDKDLTEKWIRKTEIQQLLSRIAVKLDKYEEKNARLVQSIREEMKEPWEIL